MKYIITILSILFLAGSVFAQDTVAREEVATGLRADGKIYVVIAVAVTILLGLMVYVISIDRKISRLEKENH